MDWELRLHGRFSTILQATEFFLGFATGASERRRWWRRIPIRRRVSGLM